MMTRFYCPGILLFFLLQLGLQPLQAQYNTLNEWYIGPRVGAAGSTITTQPIVDKTWIIGKDAGFTIRYISEKHFGFELGVNYSEAGWKELESKDYDNDGIYLERFYQRNLQFVDIPFLMHAFTSAGAARFFLNVGPQFSYLLGENEYNVSPFSLPQHGKLVEKPFQYGIRGGLGFEVHLGPCALGLEGGGCYFLSNLFNDEVGEDFVTSDLQKIYANVFFLVQLSGNKKK